MEVGGVALPAPALPEAWLELAYGPHWRIPDPSFQWDTPPSTLRRFENSYGVFNRQRVFWEKSWQRVDKRVAGDGEEFDDADRFLRLLPEQAFVVDLGCGDGRQAERIAAAGHRVLGVDYSFEAIRVARQTQPENADYRFLNLNDRHGLLGFALELIDQGCQPYFFARNLLHELPRLGRADLFVMLRGLLDGQTLLYATFDATPVERIAANPETWNLSVKSFAAEAWRWRLGTTVLTERQRVTPYGQRRNVAALVWT
jgi:SAM-dependent methyltransferase